MKKLASYKVIPAGEPFMLVRTEVEVANFLARCHARGVKNVRCKVAVSLTQDRDPTAEETNRIADLAAQEVVRRAQA